MKNTAWSWLQTKYKFFVADSARKGINRAVSETLYEFRHRRKFRNIGIVHAEYVSNLPATNAKSVNKDAHENQPSSFYSLNRAFRHFNIKFSEITLLDVGCGAGRVLSLCMSLNFKAVYGVDLDEPAIADAISNCTKMQEMGYRSSFQISHEDACEYTIPEDVNVVYLFNPFGKKTMEKVADNIIRHSVKRNDDVYIVYSNPTCHDIFINNARFIKIFESFFKNEKPDIFIFKINNRTIA